MRIYAISDLHTDFRENRQALERIGATGHRDDVLIVAGDVADSETVLRETLELLAGRFREVFFVPGNHELWVRGEPRDSMEKFQSVLRICDQVGVRTSPARVGDAWIVPLFSWYDPSFDVNGEGAEDELEAWADRYFTRWPANLGRVDQAFLRMNGPHVRPYDAPVVTFSHFVPRPELVPSVKYLRFRGLPLVAGSLGIEEQIRVIQPRVHVFGHTHIPEDRVLDGVRYVQNHFSRGAGTPPGAPLKLVWTGVDDVFDPPMFC
ncbi:metallophosphoesterase [Longimicrobium sp.]|uniref:metallophosphoesterase family protein n=1 Tax=Longimicrobium sp. TaxID=2029185 RepID=UPI002E325E90|nr:metallophosphoesterase [Longimicrobium sp.]HEX6040348.1 metallophosphoesterase [Longimicrobium sp.]